MTNTASKDSADMVVVSPDPPPHRRADGQLRQLPRSVDQLLSEEPSSFSHDRRLLLRGKILDRKVLSRALTFSNLKIEGHAQIGKAWVHGPPSQRVFRSQDGTTVIGDYFASDVEICSLCFTVGVLDSIGAFAAQEESSWQWEDFAWLAFPQRRGDLPVGMRIEVSVLLAPAYRYSEPVVRRWRQCSEPKSGEPSCGDSMPRDMVAHHRARNIANSIARNELAIASKGPSLCKIWASSVSRGCCDEDGCTFRHYFEGSEEQARVTALDMARQASMEIRKQEQTVYDELQDQKQGHEDKKDKKFRASCFASWLLQQYGRDSLCKGSGVLDVAGGQGDLSWELSMRWGVPCTLIDPGLRRGGKLKSWQRRELRKTGKQGFAHLPFEFNAQNFGLASLTVDPNVSCSGLQQQPVPSPYADLLNRASIVLGLHPDEATEAVVDLALASHRKFAVVPCCVYANVFPGREISPGVPVRTLNQFCTYLQNKDARIQASFLDFEGRNKVLYIP